LTIRDVTRPVGLDIEFGGVGKSPFGHTVAFFSATTAFNREDFGITWNQALETGGVLVSKTFKIEIEAQLTRSEA
jgi:polyisoprenoid-binding protein YceI